MRKPNTHRRLRQILVLALGLTLSVGVGSLGAQVPETPQQPEPYTVTLPKSLVKIEMVPVPGGSVKIDSTTVDVKPFYMAATETTWEAFDAFLASGPPSKPYDATVFAADAVARPSRTYILPDLGWGHRGYPAINLNFDSAEMFCRWLSTVTGKKYRLPTEAEWELAARAGAAGAWKPQRAEIDEQAWHAENSDGTTHPVGKKAPNAYGLFDMLGNVGEWALDLEGKPVLCGPTFLDPPSAVSPSERKRWSPAWQESDPQLPQSRWWLADGPFAGFRVVCEP
jgi:formylglycine-generating enzyme required for sulfatase activity